MDIALYLSILATLIQLAGFGIYNRQVFQGTSTPNTATWTLWAFLTVIGASTYLFATGDAVKSVLFIATAAANVGTFLYALASGKFRRMDTWDYVAFIVGIIAGFIWWWYQSAAFANIIVTIAVGIAFFPLCRGVWKNPRVERPLPWYIWAFAYGLTTLVVILRWEDPLDLVYPVAMLVLHASVGVLAGKSSR